MWMMGTYEEGAPSLPFGRFDVPGVVVSMEAKLHQELEHRGDKKERERGN